MLQGQQGPGLWLCLWRGSDPINMDSARLEPNTNEDAAIRCANIGDKEEKETQQICVGIVHYTLLSSVRSCTPALRDPGVGHCYISLLKKRIISQVSLRRTPSSKDKTVVSEVAQIRVTIRSTTSWESYLASSSLRFLIWNMDTTVTYFTELPGSTQCVRGRKIDGDTEEATTGGRQERRRPSSEEGKRDRRPLSESGDDPGRAMKPGEERAPADGEGWMGQQAPPPAPQAPPPR